MFRTHAGNIIVSTLLCYIPHYTQATLLPYYFNVHLLPHYLITSLLLPPYYLTPPASHYLTALQPQYGGLVLVKYHLQLQRYN